MQGRSPEDSWLLPFFKGGVMKKEYCYTVGKTGLIHKGEHKKEGDVICFDSELSAEKVTKLGLTPSDGSVQAPADDDNNKEKEASSGGNEGSNEDDEKRPSVEKLKGDIADVKNIEYLRELLVKEDRVTGKAAIEARIKELEDQS